MTYQSVTILGNLGKDPDLKFTPSGQQVCSFSVATNSKYTTKDGAQVEEVVWWRVTTWGNLAETCNQYLTKGRTVLVTGRLTADENGGPRIWTGSDGTPKASFELTALEVKFIGSKGQDD